LVKKNFQHFAINYYGISDLGITLPHVSSKLKNFTQKNEDFDQTYLKTDSKTQNVEDLSLDLIFHNDFW
jgi:hypothetical protein